LRPRLQPGGEHRRRKSAHRAARTLTSSRLRFCRMSERGTWEPRSSLATMTRSPGEADVMKLYRLILMPDGTVHEQDRVDTNDIDPGLLEAFGTRFSGLRWDSSVPTESGKLRVVWNGSESGIALGTFWLDEQMFLCTVLAAGFEPEHDEYILN